MDIEEAVNHCYTVAKQMYKDDPCSVCAAEHEQLAHWLEELQAYRALGPVEEPSALVKARDEGRVVPDPCGHCLSGTYRGCEGCGYNPVTDAELALGGGGDG